MSNRNLDHIKPLYVDWLMTPPGQRDPETKTEFAELHGIARNTLWRWEGEPEIQKELLKLKVKWGVRLHPEILENLMDIVRNSQADGSRVRAAEVLLKHLDVGEQEKTDSEMDSHEMIQSISKWLKENEFNVIADE